MIVTLVSFCIISIFIDIITYISQIIVDNGYLKNTSALYSWNMAYKKLMDISYIVKEISCIQSGYISNDVWNFADIFDLLRYDMEYVGASALIFKQFIESFAIDVYLLVEDLRDKILQTQISVVDVDPITFALNPNYIIRDIISAAYELINGFIYIGVIPSEERWHIIREIVYIINNVYGDMCVVQQKINTIILQAIFESYNDLQYSKIIKYSIVISLGIFCLLVLIYQMMKYYNRQCHFLKNLNRLCIEKMIRIQKNIENTLEFLKSNALEENLIEFKYKLEKQDRDRQILIENHKAYKSNNQPIKIESTLIKRRII